MTTNGIIPHPAASTPVVPSFGPALLEAERTGQLPAAVWPAIRDLLLASTDPQLAAAVEPLRQVMQTRQAVATAHQELEQGYAAVATTQDDPRQFAEAASALSMFADELAGRAQQLADLDQ